MIGSTAILTNMATTYCGLADVYIPNEFMQLSSFLAFLNAVSSVPLLPKDSVRRSLFIESIRFQSLLSYMGMRVFYTNEFLQFTDGFVTQQFILATINMWFLSNKVPEDVNPIGFKFIILVASILGLYPLQFAIGGPDFILDFYEKYPDQALAFSKYVYCPSQLVVMIIMFGATLLQRNMIRQQDMKQWIVILPVLIFFSTIVSQEIYIPYTSTQDIIVGIEYTNPIYLFHKIKEMLFSHL